MEKRTMGEILSVKTQWWLKVNTKSVRIGPLDGATFPHVVKVKYTVDGKEIIKKKWLGASANCPSVGERVCVVYREDKPTKFRLEGHYENIQTKAF